MAPAPLTKGIAPTDHLEPYDLGDRAPHPDRPWVLANMVAGLDGSTAIGGRVGALSGAADRALFLDLRSVADVVLVGAETVRRERYGPVRLAAGRQAAREAAGRALTPRLAVVSRSLDFEQGAAWLAPPPPGVDRPMIITCSASPGDRRDRLADSAEIVLAGTDRVDVVEALGALRRAGEEIVLCEGGSALLGELLGAGVVDELCLTLTPLVGGDPIPVASAPADSEVRRATLAHVLEADGDLFLRYLF